jgi:uncharacterized membrane protein YdbT with pleckstrin-like domain
MKYAVLDVSSEIWECYFKIYNKQQKKGVVMFKKFLSVLVLSSVCFVFSATAQTSQSAGLSGEDTKNLKEAAQVLGKAFDLKIEKKDSVVKTVPPVQQEQPKTMADVANKGLDMVKGFVVALSSTLEKVAPQVWRVMVRQQYAKAISMLILPWGFLLLIIFYLVIIKKIWKTPKTKADLEDETLHIEDGPDIIPRRWLTIYIPFLAGIIVVIVGLFSLSDALLYLINPEYYAIKDLLEMILK